MVLLFDVPGVRWAFQRVSRVLRGTTLGVQGVLLDADNRVLLVRHGYVRGWCFPGGGVERGESVMTALHREMREEVGATLTGPPHLHGVFTNFESFPGDHIAVYIIRAFERPKAPASSLEIREQGFFARNALPNETGAGSRRRLDEILDGRPPAEAW